MWELLAEIWLWILLAAILLVVGGIALAVIGGLTTTFVTDVYRDLRDPKERGATGCALAIVAFILIGFLILYMAGRKMD